MDIKVIKSLEHKDWDKFVNGSNNGTIFHKLRFLQYHTIGSIKFHNLAFYDNNKLVAVLPCSLNDSVLKSPAGASYGSFVTNDMSFRDHEEVIKTFVKYAKKQKVKEIFLTPPPIFYSKRENEILQFLLLYEGFSPVNTLITNSLDLKLISNIDVSSVFKNSFRQAVKKSTTYNVKVLINQDYVSFYKMLTENKKKFKAKPTHTYKELLRLTNLFPDDIKLLMAYTEDNRPAGAILFFICNSKTVLAFYICQDYQFQHLRVVNRLLHELVTWCKTNGYDWLDLGVSMDTLSQNNMEPSRSLIFFKEGINTRGFLRTTYSIRF